MAYVLGHEMSHATDFIRDLRGTANEILGWPKDSAGRLVEPANSRANRFENSIRHELVTENN